MREHKFHCGEVVQFQTDNDVRLIELRGCLCGHQACTDVWLSGIGKFVQGSGFTRAEAEKIADTLNAEAFCIYYRGRVTYDEKLQRRPRDLEIVWQDNDCAERAQENVALFYQNAVMEAKYGKG